MKLESKLGISTGVLILAMLLSAFTAHLRTMDARRISDELGRERIPFIITMHDLRGHMAKSVRDLQSSMIFGPQWPGHPAFHNDLLQTQRAIETDLALLRGYDTRMNLGPDQGKIQSIAVSVEQLDRLEQQVEALSDLGTPEGAVPARALLEQQVLALNAAVYDATTSVMNSQSALEQEEIASLQRANKSVLLALWTATILGALFGGLVSTLFARHVSRAIDLVADRAKAIASGDLTGTDLGIRSSDQIGSLARAMQQMQSSLASIIGMVATTAGSLTTSAASMRNASDQIHRRIDQQSQQTHQAATAMQEMSASIAEVSRHTQSAADTARSAAQTAHEGGDIVKQMLVSMHSIATAVSDTSCTIGLLGQDSKRISQIVTVIDEIARKTNLLALNAAIEAARAGDQGRGFAVVAGEVRRLAESTAHATSEISAMIQGIQDRTRTAVASMASGTQTVQQGVVTTNQAGEALERIIGMAERVDRMITQIAIAASQQAVAADQSSASLDAIHSLSHENLTEMATTAAGIETLRSTAATLEKQVESFQLQAPSPSANLKPRVPPPTPLRPMPQSRPANAAAKKRLA